MANLIFDFDGTIASYMDTIPKVYEILHGHKKGYTPIKTRGWLSDADMPLHKKGIQDLVSQPIFFKNLVLFDNAKEVLEELALKYNHNIYICTRGATINLSKKAIYIPKTLPFAKIILIDYRIPNKSIINMGESHFVDDETKNLIASDAVYKYCYGNLDYNQNWTGNRLVNYEEVYKTFSTIS